MADTTEKEQQIASLAEKASVCVACDLCESRTHVVFGEGKTGRPFVGRAGKLLDECLRECGILRRHVFVTNVVRCRPTIEEGGRLKNRPPRTDEANTCISL